MAIEDSRGIPGLVLVDADSLAAIGAAALGIEADAIRCLRDVMTPLRAAHVRWLRVERECTWRGVAFECHEEWRASWKPASSQIWGMALCRVAAEALGEDFRTAPWN